MKGLYDEDGLDGPFERGMREMPVFDVIDPEFAASLNIYYALVGASILDKHETDDLPFLDSSTLRPLLNATQRAEVDAVRVNTKTGENDG